MTAPKVPPEDQTKKKPAFFATENPEDPAAVAGRTIREGEYATFGRFAQRDPEGDLDSPDYDQLIAQLSTSTGLRRGATEKGVTAYMSLRDLPGLRAMQEQTKRLDVDRLDAVGEQLADLGNNATPEVYKAIDDLLVSIFTPKKINQELPTRVTITRRLHVLIAQYDTSAAYDEKARRKREEKKDPIEPGNCEFEYREGIAGVGTSGLSLIGDNATMAAAKSFIDSTARANSLTQSQAALKLLTGELAPAPGAKIYAYAPLAADGSLDQSKPVYIVGFGWTTAAGTAVFHDIVEKAMREKTATFVDMEAAATREVSGYVAPDDIKAFVRARDGGCIFPGCTVPARKCQLDHRIPFDDGGKTTAENLFLLCQHHHNLKTDKRAYYLPDPVTGEIVWLFSDGTYRCTQPTGFLASLVTPTAPKWRHTLEDIQRLNRKKARFYARGHKLIDDYETDPNPNPEHYLAAIQALEKEFGMVFPFKPDIPEKSPEVEQPEDAPPF